MSERTDAKNWWRVLGWAFYLACSWTWCIGMFLPVLLVGDYGVWGFVVFAVPNVVGAGAMGWVLKAPGASERMVHKHRVACECFSWVTIAFQVFWLTQMRPWMPVGDWAALGGWGALLAAGLVLSVAAADARWRVVGAAAAGVWLISMIALSGVARHDAQADGFWTARPDLVWLAPVMVFGFGLCPYLDVTFHRARQAAPGAGGTVAFVIGFGVLFVPMLLMTLSYCGAFSLIPTGYLDKALTVHWVVQAMFTVAAHLTPLAWALGGLKREGRAIEFARLRRRVGWLIGAVSGIGIAGAVLLPGFDLSRLSRAEIIYRCFMAFYGLIFPAYVWLLMIPTRDGHSGLGGERGRRKLLIWAGAVGIAAPMFWMGFIDQREVWLAPGLGVVLAARLVLPRAARENAATC